MFERGNILILGESDFLQFGKRKAGWVNYDK